ncbi:winged helix-turn-helix domain-containing protein [Sphingoaurantiacus capsulatus]|uniref:Winged helix-turn-helix domain-containing protein n=1 Tax=Sphingoaurantiacus capsulatus TaxID=1771310 RepID=A0ABV7XAT8_9SPHN
MTTIELSAKEARRIALTASGLAKPRPARPGPAAFDAMLDRLSMVQMDSVNVLARAHYMPGFARLGDYDPTLLDKAAWSRKRSLFEYWGHAACLIRTELQPALRWRMEGMRAGTDGYVGLRRFAAERGDFIAEVLRQIEQRGPLASRELEGGGKATGSWWGWSEGKRALEWLFSAGLVTTHSRPGFERIYDITERVLPEAVALPTPTREEGQRQLILAAAQALGVGTVADLSTYWYIKPKEGAARIAELVEAGALVSAKVQGWRDAAWLLPGITSAPKPQGAAIVSPFDPLMWERDRVERMFDFRYRIEIYVPAHLRQHGYYVLPFLMGDRIAARLDLKADRKAGTLVVAASHLEPGADLGAVAPAVSAELALLAKWLKLGAIRIDPRGDLAPHLSSQG